MPTPIGLVFDKLLTLENDEVIVLPFSTEAEMKSKKVMFFREKKKYEERMKNAPNFKVFFIGQEVNKAKGTFNLKLSTNGCNLDWFTNAVIQKKGEEAKALDSILETSEEKRIKELKK